MAVRVLKRKIVKQAPPVVKKGHNLKGRSAEFNPELVHKVMRAVYIDGLRRGGSEEPFKMTSEKIDMNCLLYGPQVRAAIRALVELGVIDTSRLK